jgi:hypothetical protein
MRSVERRNVPPLLLLFFFFWSALCVEIFCALADFNPNNDNTLLGRMLAAPPFHNTSFVLCFTFLRRLRAALSRRETTALRWSYRADRCGCFVARHVLLPSPLCFYRVFFCWCCFGGTAFVLFTLHTFCLGHCCSFLSVCAFLSPLYKTRTQQQQPPYRWALLRTLLCVALLLVPLSGPVPFTFHRSLALTLENTHTHIHIYIYIDPNKDDEPLPNL